VLTCPYHSWTYDLDGRLRGCAHMQRSENFDKADWRLAEFRSEIWHGFVFVNFDGKASPLAEQYADFSNLIAPWRTEDMEVAIALQWECAFNWKVMIENWMESYHHIGIHGTTLNPSMPGQNTWIEPEHPHFIRAHLPFHRQPRARGCVRQRKLASNFPASGRSRAFRSISRPNGGSISGIRASCF